MPSKLGRCADNRVKRGCCPEAMDFFGTIGKLGCGQGRNKKQEEFPLTKPTCVTPCRNPRRDDETHCKISKKMIKEGCGCMQSKKRPANQPQKGKDDYPMCQEPKYRQQAQEKESDYCIVELDEQQQQGGTCCGPDCPPQQFPQFQQHQQQQYSPFPDPYYQQQQPQQQQPYPYQPQPPYYNGAPIPRSESPRTAVFMMPCDSCCYPMILILSPT